MMTTKVKGLTVKQAEELSHHFVEMVTRNCLGERHQSLGNLMVFEGVRKFPVRVKCATLIWRTLESAIKNRLDVKHIQPSIVTTE